MVHRVSAAVPAGGGRGEAAERDEPGGLRHRLRGGGLRAALQTCGALGRDRQLHSALE